MAPAPLPVQSHCQLNSPPTNYTAAAKLRLCARTTTHRQLTAERAIVPDKFFLPRIGLQ